MKSISIFVSCFDAMTFSDAPRLLIFDIDGTLTHTGGLWRRAFNSGIERLFGIPDASNGVHPQGKTDPAIFQEIINRHKIESADFERGFSAFCVYYLDELERLFDATGYPSLQPGVGQLLAFLANERDIHLALGTGNIEAGADLKLNRVGIRGYFPIGGFGSDHIDRKRVISVARRRAESHYGMTFEPANCWVIGDTPLDIISGKSIGANTLAVTTGLHRREQLSTHSPTAIIDNFTNIDQLMNFVRGD